MGVKKMLKVHGSWPGYFAVALWLSMPGFSSCTNDPVSGLPTQREPLAVDQHLLWRVPGYDAVGEPAVDATSVYYQGRNHSLTAVVKSTGVVRWHVQFPIDASLLPGRSALVLPGQIIVGDQDVFSVEPSSGAVRWRFHTTEGRRPGYQAPFPYAGILYTGSGSGHVFALDQTTGALRWMQAVADTSDGVFRPVVADGVVFVGVSRFPATGAVGSRVAALDAQTGMIRWTRDLPVTAATPATGAKDVVLVGAIIVASCGDGTVFGLDRTTGATQWTAPRVEPPAGSSFPNPLEQDARGLTTDGVRVYVSSVTGIVVALSPTDGAQLWKSSVSYGSLLDLRTDGRFVYGVHLGGAFTVLDAATGAVNWIYDGQHFAAVQGETFYDAVAFDDINMYLSATHGLYAFRK